MTRLQRLTRGILGLAAERHLADEIHGDLVEEHEARRQQSPLGAALWLVPATFSLAIPLLWSRTPFARTASLVSPPLPATRRGLPMSTTDLRLALRLMFKQPVLSGTAIVALAVAMCLAVAGFTVMNSVLLAELPLPEGERYVFFRVTNPETLRQVDVPYETFDAWTTRATTLSALGGFHWGQGNLELEDSTPVVLRLAYLTPAGLAMTQVEPVHGRLFDEQDALAGAAPAALIREDLWRQHLDADPAAVGRPIRVSGNTYTLVGVLPEEFTFPESQNLWLPLHADPADGHDHSGIEAYGILQPDTGLAEAAAELRTLLEGTTPPGEQPLRLQVLPFAKGMTGEGFELFMMVALVLLLMILAVAAANVANLILVRTSARSAELAVRAALGASRVGLVLQVFVEVLVLGALAAGIAVVAAIRIVAWLDALIASEAPMWINMRVEPVVVLFAAFLALFATAIASIAPALRSTTGSLDQALRHGSAAVASPQFGRASASLVLVEIALSVALLSGAAVLGRGLVGYQWADLGIDETRVLTASLYLPPDLSSDEEVEIGQSLARELEVAPQIVRAGLTMELPKQDARMRDLEIDRGREQEPLAARVAYTGPGFLDSLGIEPRAGRLFAPGDHADDAPSVTVVNESFARTWFPAGDAVGQRLRYAATPGEDPGDWREIVGVVQDLGLSPGVPDQAAGLYVPVRRSNFYFATARFNGPVGEAASALRRIVAEHDARILVRDIQTLERVGWEARTLLRSVALGLAALGAMAMALSAAGIYAMMAFSVQQRTREIGVRVALGADRGRILRGIMGSTSGRLLGGAVVGVALAVLLAQATVILPIEVPPLRPFDVAFMALVMVGAGLLAAWFPARRASRIDPVDALRAD